VSPPTLHRRTGVRKQFLITGGKTIFGFVAKKGGKFGNCPCATDITAAANCKSLTGLSAVTLRNSLKSQGQKRVKGSPCQWLDLDRVREEGSDCVDGAKFVVSKDKGVRRQYLYMEGRSVLAFVKNGEKFADCLNYTDVTADVKCKVLAGVASVPLASDCSSVSTPTTSAETGESVCLFLCACVKII